MNRPAFIIHAENALGDTVCLSALVRDIQLAYPGQYDIQVSGHYSGVYWRNNPHCRVDVVGAKGRKIKLEYVPGIQAAGHGCKKHFLSYFHQRFAEQTGIRVPVFHPHGDIHLSREEQAKEIFPGRYWVVMAGGKRDMTAKIWYAKRFQETVDALAARGITCVQAGARFERHYHPKLPNCHSVVGATNNERDFFTLISKAEGVICGITAAMHIAAVFHKPCVVIAGGREEPWWEAYTNAYAPEGFGPECKPVEVEHVFLHTVGLLDCGLGNLHKGCWRSRAVPIDADDRTNAKKKIKLCTKPTVDGPQTAPECMHMITVDHVVEGVMSYYESGRLPPIGQPSKRYHLPVTEPAVSNWLPAEVPVRRPEDPDLSVLDHPHIGGRFTVFVLGHGEYHTLFQRCIASLLTANGHRRLDIRVALNQPNKKMLEYATAFPKEVISKVYVDHGTRRKYPAMREMFWDALHPITTKYLMWFDDDSHVGDSKWLVKLGEAIVANHPLGCRMYGPKYFHAVSPTSKSALGIEWFKQARWWKNEWLHLSGGQRRAPNGNQIVFASGGFWALATETMRAADIPDVRLNHNGGDITIGCQLVQAGGKLFNFTPDKSIVIWSDAKRRGFQESFPWQ